MKLARSLLLGTTAAVLLAAAPTGAHAGAFGSRAQSTIALGQAFAGNASGAAGVTSAFWNPATITMRPGYNSEYNFTYVDASARINVLAPTPTLPLGNTGELAQSGLAPASATSYQITDQVWLGLTTGAPYGNITKPNETWAGQTYSRSSRVISLSFAPIIGIKVTDWLSIGAGPSLEYFKVRLRSAAGVAGPAAAGNVLLEGDEWNAGVLAGVTITPMAGTDLGFGFRSGVNHDLEGTLRTPLGVTPIRVNLTLPDTFTFGLTQAISSNFRVNLGFEWQTWSNLQTPIITLRNGSTPVVPFPLNYKDGYLFSLGGEYQYDPRWTLRAGVAYEISPIDVSNRSTRLPDTDRIYTSVGASYAWNDKLTINASYAHIFSVGNNRVQITPGNPLYNGLPFFGIANADVNYFSAGFRYRWDDPKVAEVSPLIRKF